MQDRPTAAEILAAIGEYLQQDVLPLVEGAVRYRTLVAANLVALLGREIDAVVGAAETERADLVALLGIAGAEGGQERRVEDLSAILQARLVAAEPLEGEFLRASREVLERSVRDKLATNKPGYDAYDMADEGR